MTIDDFFASPRGQAVVEAAARGYYKSRFRRSWDDERDDVHDYFRGHVGAGIRAALTFDDGQGPHPFLDVIAEYHYAYLYQVWSPVYVPRQPREEPTK